MDPSATAAATAARAPVPVRVFARGFALRAAQTAWLLGAGASADAGVPTAGQLIDELLAILYCSENGIRHADLTRDPRWQQRVRGFYDGRYGLPAWADAAFYSAIFEKVYPDRDARARFIMDRLAGRRPHPGQHTLAALVAAGLAPVLITTNFDTLLEDAIRPALDPAAPARLTVLDPESSAKAAFSLATDARPLLMKIHGDLGAVTVKNTTAELAEQDKLLRAATLSLLGRHGLLVAGYSGRDPAVMAMLRDVLAQPTPYPAGLTWARRPEDELTPEVADLLAAARAAGVEPVHEVVASGMMELMAETELAVDLPPASRRAPGRPPPGAAALPGPAAVRPGRRLPPDQAGHAAAAVGPGPGPAARGPGRAAAAHPAAGAEGRRGPRDAGPPGRRPARRLRRRRPARRRAGRDRRAGHRHRSAGRPRQGRQGTRQHRPGTPRRGAGPGPGPDPRPH